METKILRWVKGAFEQEVSFKDEKGEVKTLRFSAKLTDDEVVSKITGVEIAKESNTDSKTEVTDTKDADIDVTKLTRVQIIEMLKERGITGVEAQTLSKLKMMLTIELNKEGE